MFDDILKVMLGEDCEKGLVEVFNLVLIFCIMNDCVVVSKITNNGMYSRSIGAYFLR